MLYCYLNGKIIPENKAAISVNDIGILRGYGVFEYIRTYNGKPFLLKEHLDRLEKSAEIIGLKVPVSKKQLKEEITKLKKKNNLKEASIRIVLTGGPTNDGVNHLSRPTLFILNRKPHDYSKELFGEGAKVITSEYQREFARAKTINHLKTVVMQKECRQKGAAEILFVKGSRVLEGSRSNFFIFRGNQLITQKDDILLGTMRNFILKNLAKGRFVVKERNLKVSELDKATEAFITGTDRKIMPVVKIDNEKVGNGRVGRNTKCLMDLFEKHIKNY